METTMISRNVFKKNVHALRSSRVAFVMFAAGLLGAGCQSPGVRAFETSSLCEQWTRVHGSEQFTAGNPHHFADWHGPEDTNNYYVVASEQGAVIAKAIIRAKLHPKYELRMRAQAFDEFLSVGGSYPFPDELIRVVEPQEGLPVGEIRRWTYGPLATPGSAEDPILPSGVRTSSWARLILELNGWPFDQRWSSGARTARLDGAAVEWSDLLTKVRTEVLDGDIAVTD